MTPKSGSACGSLVSSTLTRRGDQFTFTPGDGVLVITGNIATDGSLHGSLALIGANKQPFPLTVDGAITPEGFTGTYSTPRCEAKIQLRPTRG